MSSAAATAPHRAALDIGVNTRVPVGNAVVLGFQNVFVMTGIFVFPGIMGKAFHLPLDTVAYLYAVTFMGCGVTSLLMSLAFGRMPLVAGPYAGIFAALVTFGHLDHGKLGSAFGSLAVASLLWCLLSIPIRGFSPVAAGVAGDPHAGDRGGHRHARDDAGGGPVVPALDRAAGRQDLRLLNVGSGLVTALVLMVADHLHQACRFCAAWRC